MLIISILFTVNFASCVAYSAVCIIFPARVLNKGLSSFYSGIIIAAYPFSQMITANIINNLLNQKGKKVTLMAGAISLGIALAVFGYADYL